MSESRQTIDAVIPENLREDVQNESTEDTRALKVKVDSVFKLERETATVLRPYYEYFGLTPASRARISVPKPKDEPSAKWTGVLK